MRKRCVLHAVLIVTVLGGCAAGSVTGRAAQPVVQASAGLPETGRFSLEITQNRAGGDVLLTAAGVFDHRNRRYVLEVGGQTVTSSRFGWAAVRRTIAVGEVLYLDAPGLAAREGVTTPWMSVHLGHDDDPLHLREFDPARLLDRLHSKGAVVERGADGLVRRVTVRFDAPGGDGVVLTVAYSDLGAPVTIDAPPADQVTDVTDAIGRRSRRPTGG